MSSKVNSRQIKDFQDIVWEFFSTEGRILPWRETIDPYKILVSEMMLQQTQVARVVPKYDAFLKAFPTIQALANGTLPEVLTLWVGLGYNRRARYLHMTAQQVVTRHKGILPTTSKDLQDLPGIGPYTASAVMTFAYNAREVLIETNVRTVYIHHFFTEMQGVSDANILELIDKTLPNEQNNKTSYKEWYWALMDYGSYLKETLPNPSRKSKHHSTQSKFKGSLREARGLIIRILSSGSTTEARLLCQAQEQDVDSARIIKALKSLEQERFIELALGSWQVLSEKI